VTSVPGQVLEDIATASVALTARAIGTVAADLTVLQWRALVVTAADEGGVSVGELAERVGLRPSAASRLVGRLVDRGLVMAHREDADRRIRCLRLTPAGRRLHRQVVAVRARDLGDVATAIAADPDADRVLALLAEALQRAAAS
jgi:DNA-binding MarR family transcriptional regulator